MTCPAVDGYRCWGQGATRMVRSTRTQNEKAYERSELGDAIEFVPYEEASADVSGPQHGEHTRVSACFAERSAHRWRPATGSQIARTHIRAAIRCSAGFGFLDNSFNR